MQAERSAKQKSIFLFAIPRRSLSSRTKSSTLEQAEHKNKIYCDFVEAQPIFGEANVSKFFQYKPHNYSKKCDPLSFQTTDDSERSGASALVANTDNADDLMCDIQKNRENPRHLH